MSGGRLSAERPFGLKVDSSTCTELVSFYARDRTAAVNIQPQRIQNYAVQNRDSGGC